MTNVRFSCSVKLSIQEKNSLKKMDGLHKSNVDCIAVWWVWRASCVAQKGKGCMEQLVCWRTRWWWWWVRVSLRWEWRERGEERGRSAWLKLSFSFLPGPLEKGRGGESSSSKGDGGSSFSQDGFSSLFILLHIFHGFGGQRCHFWQGAAAGGGFFFLAHKVCLWILWQVCLLSRFRGKDYLGKKGAAAMYTLAV